MFESARSSFFQRLHIYSVLCRQVFSDQLTHRTELFIWAALDAFPTIMLFFVWTSIFRGAETIRGFTLPQIIQYYFLMMLLNNLTAAHFEAVQSTNIRQGKIDLYFTRPLSYISYIFWTFTARKIFYFFTVLPISLGVLLVLSFSMHMTLSVPTMNQLTQLIPLFFFGYLLQFMLAMYSVLLVFWFEGANSLEHFKWVMTWVFSGAILPRAFMPDWLQFATDHLPFKYIFAIPVEVYQGTLTLHTLNWLEMFAWMGVCFTLLGALWHYGRRKYSSAGG